MKSANKPDGAPRVAGDLQIFMTGYAITGFEAGGEMKVEREDEVVLGEEVGRNKGHPKLHSCTSKIFFEPECIYNSAPRPALPGLTVVWDPAV